MMRLEVLSKPMLKELMKQLTQKEWRVSMLALLIICHTGHFKSILLCKLETQYQEFKMMMNIHKIFQPIKNIEELL